MLLYQMGVRRGRGLGLIFGRKNISNRARCETCSKLTIKAPEYVQTTIKLKISLKLV